LLREFCFFVGWLGGGGRRGAGGTYKSVLLPYNGLVLVGVGVVVALDLARLASKEPVQVRAHLIGLAFLERVALRASCLK
jgi:hypothetical protein